MLYYASETLIPLDGYLSVKRAEAMQGIARDYWSVWKQLRKAMN